MLVGQDDEHRCLLGYDAEGPAAGNAVDMGRGGVEVGGCGRDTGACSGLGVVGWIFPALMVSILGPLNDAPHEMVRHKLESARTGMRFGSELPLTSAIAASSMLKMPHDQHHFGKACQVNAQHSAGSSS